MAQLYIGGGRGPSGGPGFGGPVVGNGGAPLSFGPGTGSPVGGPKLPMPGIDPSKVLNGKQPNLATPSPTPPNVLGAQSVRASGAPPGFDPSYLQNLSTAIGGLFSRPGGNLSFNPLGDLSGISQPTGGGNSPVPGLPSTLLQDALNGLAFLFGPQASAPTGTTASPTVNSGNGNAGGPGGRNSSY